jgi:hypothetical protein
MLEALACGTRRRVPGDRSAARRRGRSDGGVLDSDLRRAAMRALSVPRERARARALTFDWDRVARDFVGHLAPVRATILRAERVSPRSATA